jgi:hypothetical protein
MLEWFDTMQSATSAHGSQKVRKARSIALTCDNGSIALESALSKTVGEEVEFLPTSPELEPYTGPGRTGFFASCRFPLEPEATSEAAEPMQRKKKQAGVSKWQFVAQNHRAFRGDWDTRKCEGSDKSETQSCDEHIPIGND